MVGALACQHKTRRGNSPLPCALGSGLMGWRRRGLRLLFRLRNGMRPAVGDIGCMREHRHIEVGGWLNSGGHPARSHRLHAIKLLRTIPYLGRGRMEQDRLARSPAFMES